MSEVIISAFVAATVSLIGILVNFYIVHKNQQLTKSERRAVTFTDTHKISISSLRAFCKDCELFRLRVAKIRNSIARFRREKIIENDEKMLSQWGNITQVLTVDAEDLLSSSRQFEEKWADVRGDVKEATFKFLSPIRHEGMQIVRIIIDKVSFIGKKTSKEEILEEIDLIRTIVDEIEESANTVVDQLDKIFSSVNEERLNLLSSAIVGDEESESVLRMQRGTG